MRRVVMCVSVSALLLLGSRTSWAQEPQPGGDPALEARMAALEQELALMRKKMEDEAAAAAKEEKSLLSGWQLQLRGMWFTMAHNHRDNVFSGDDHQHGWAAGVGFMIPLWNELGGGPIDLNGHLSIDYRQLAYSTEFTAPVTGVKGTASYLNVIAGPVLRLAVSDTIRPFVLVGANMQVCSPPQDPITYLDLGFVAGLGVDVKLHERVSVGLDYKFTWFGVADQEEEDYGMLGAYIGFNF